MIKNRDQLLSHGHVIGRDLALGIIDYVMQSIDASGLTRNRIHLQGNLLMIDSLQHDLPEVNHVFVLGAGKGVLQIAQALEDVLGDKITDGVIVEKRLNGMTRGLERINHFKRIKVLQAGHPIPDEAAVEGGNEILRMARLAKEKDLVFFCVQGGCTCLTTLPARKVTLQDVKATTNLLLHSGLEIGMVNNVRTAMTQLSAGRLAKHVYPARIVNIVVNDYVWNYPGEEKEDAYRLGWGPCVPVSELRRREFEWTISSLMTHSVWRRFPPAVRNALLNLEPEQYPQTVKDFENMGIKYQTIVLASPQDAAEAAAKKSISMGVPSMILSSMLEGEAREVGIVFGGIAKEIAQNSRPLPPPCAIIAAGDKTVTLTEESGEGGRNQEFVLSAALKIGGGHKIVIVSVGTDGTDGPTNIAWGIADGFTLRRAKERGIDLIENLRKHNSASVLISLEDAIYFDEPGNNLCDLSIIIVTE